MTPAQIKALAWGKGDGLLPAVVQHAQTGQVLMVAFMNEAALATTLQLRRVTFFSRSKQRLWTKGETSNHFLNLVDIAIDCDDDSILVTALPAGPTCHTGSTSCFGDDIKPKAANVAFLGELEDVISQRVEQRPEGSYTAKLWSDGITRMAQKVGEEGVEVALAAVTQDNDRLIGESADLLFHLALVLKKRGLSMFDVVRELEQRHEAKR